MRMSIRYMASPTQVVAVAAVILGSGLNQGRIYTSLLDVVQNRIIQVEGGSSNSKTSGLTGKHNFYLINTQ